MDVIKDQPWLPALAALVSALLTLFIGLWANSADKRRRELLKIDLESMRLLMQLREEKDIVKLPHMQEALELVNRRIKHDLRGIAPYEAGSIEEAHEVLRRRRHDRLNTAQKWAALFTIVAGSVVTVSLAVVWLGKLGLE